MEGGVSYVDAFDQRMIVLNPTQNDLNAFLSQFQPSFTPGVQAFLQRLQSDEKEVYLVSGGIADVISFVFRNN